MFNNLNIKGKLFLGFGVVILISAIIGGLGVYAIIAIDTDLEHLYEVNLRETEELSNIMESFHRSRVNVLYGFVESTNRGIDKRVNNIKEYRKKIHDAVIKFKKLAKNKDVIRYINEYESTLNTYFDYYIKAIQTNKTYREKARQLLYGKTGQKLAARLKKILKNIDEYVVKDAKTTEVHGQELATAVEIAMIVTLVIGIIISIFIALFLSSSISMPLKRGAEFCEKLSEKDLTDDLGNKILNRKDEIGVIAKAIDKVQKNFIAILEELADLANNLAASSEEISASSQNLAEGAQNQAASVEETSASMEELGSAINQVAGNSNVMNEKSDNLLKTSRQSDGLIESAEESMNKISKSSDRISEILSVINDISDQTNLLALNAAIEAARAGEHGRGFAVVADEISKLADKSVENAKEIETLIKQSMKDVENGSNIVMKAGESFKLIIEGIETNNELMDDISKAISQQKTGSDQVQTAVEEINEVTQTTSASAEEMAASTEELQAQAESVKKMIDAFNLPQRADVKTKKIKGVDIKKENKKLENKATEKK